MRNASVYIGVVRAPRGQGHGRLSNGPAIMNNPRSEWVAHRGTTIPVRLRPTQQASSQTITVNQAAALRASAGSVVKDEALFLSNLPVIDDVIGQICRRHRLTASEAEDFKSEVRLLFIERNYEPLRRFEGRSRLRTYLIVVIQRLFLDYRNRLWGRWRPSAEAKRLGPLAILVERLVTRDGLTLDQAAQTLRINYEVRLDEKLSALCAKLSLRPPSRQIVPEAGANGVESSGPSPEANVLRAEQGFLARRVQTALERARQGLAAEDRIILKMRFEDAVPVADIARALHLNQKRLYRTIGQLLERIRKSLEAEDISRDDVNALFAEGALSADSIQDAQNGAGAGGMPEVAERARTPWLKG